MGRGPVNRRTVIVAALAGVGVIVAVVLGVWGLIGGPSQSRPAARPAPSVSPVPDPVLPTPGTETTVDGSGGIDADGDGVPVPASDPLVFAQQVAQMLFDWDTTADNLEQRRETLIGLGDPLGVETAGLASDLSGYLPSQAVWASLAQYATHQWIEVETVGVPGGWAEAEAQAAPGQFLPGTTAVTVTGTRHRGGIWEGEPVASAHPVGFTVFAVCAPTWPECHLLRLSTLDNPLR